MDALDLLRSRNRADIELPSGLGATIGLPRIADCIVDLGIPLPLMREIGKITSAGDVRIEDLTPEMITGGAEFQREMVRRTLKRLAPSIDALDGTPEVDMPAEVIAELDQADYDLLEAYALRERPFPAASNPT